MALRRSASALAPVAKHDYVIVGGGSAGCVLAHRLAKDAGHKVLLIENGPSDRGSWDWWKIHMPAALTFNLASKKYNWDYHTVPQKGLNGRELHQPRGRTLGGSSAINAMAYVRGHALDFERWAEEIGGEEGRAWNYRHILPYYIKAQSHVEGGSTYRGGDGPLSVSRKETPVVKAINDAFVEAGLEAGYPKAEDMNGYQQEGFGKMDMTVTPEGERASTANAYLRSLRYPKTEEEKVAGGRLQIVTNRHTTRLLFDGDRAIGVETVDSKKHNDVQQHIADAEVVLSAGAVGSPQILNLSGIGNAPDLEALGIEVRHHLPEVGQNLQDHLEFYIQYLAHHTSLYPYAATFEFLPEPLKRYAFRKPWLAAPTGLHWMLRGLGMGASNHFEVGGFIRSRAGVKHPDLQYHFIPGIVVGQLDFLPEHGYQAHCGTMRPTSRGSIKLASSDYRDSPLIDPNFLATEKDIVDMRAGVRLTVEILEQSALSDFRKERFSPKPDFDLADDASVDEWVRQHSHSGYHLSCTCAMGRVVDAKGKVFGVEGLRIADASIMPSMTSGNLNAPTIMLAEKIADAICGKEMPPVDDSVGWYEPPAWEVKQR